MAKYSCELKVIFAKRRIKQGEFAKKVGIGEGTLSSLVNEKSDPSFDTAYSISEELGLSIQEIWIKKEENKKN